MECRLSERSLERESCATIHSLTHQVPFFLPSHMFWFPGFLYFYIFPLSFVLRVVASLSPIPLFLLLWPLGHHQRGLTDILVSLGAFGRHASDAPLTIMRRAAPRRRQASASQRQSRCATHPATQKPKANVWVRIALMIARSEATKPCEMCAGGR